jgi:hypothetical protein
LVILYVGIEARAAHSIRIILVRDWAVLARARVPRRDHTFPHDASMVRGGAIVMHVVGGEAPAADLPQGAVVLIMIGRVLVAFKAVRERGGGPRSLTFLSRKEAETPLWDCPTFEAVASIFIDPF